MNCDVLNILLKEIENQNYKKSWKISPDFLQTLNKDKERYLLQVKFNSYHVWV